MKNGRRSILINLETMGSEKKRLIQMEILIKIWLIKLIVPLKMISKKLKISIKKVCIEKVKVILKSNYTLGKKLKMSKIYKTNRKKLAKRPWIYQINLMKN